MVAPAPLAVYTVVEAKGVLVRAGMEMDSRPVGKLKVGEQVKALKQQANKAGVTRIRIAGRLPGWLSITAGNGAVLLKKQSAGNDADTESESEEESTDAESTDAESSEAESSEADTSDDDQRQNNPGKAPGAAAKHQQRKLAAAAAVAVSRKPVTALRRQPPAAPKAVAKVVPGVFEVVCPTLVRAGFAMDSKQVGQLKKGEVVKVLESKLLPTQQVTRIRFTGRVNGWASMASSKVPSSTPPHVDGSMK
jgi:hypothetical protein